VIYINAPIWNGGKRCVGIAEYRIHPSQALTTFEVLYKNKAGERIYPQPFRIRTDTLLAGPDTEGEWWCDLEDCAAG